MKKIDLTKDDFNRKKAELNPSDIQALIFRGYKHLDAACYILLQIDYCTQAKAYFNWLIDNNKITTADIPGENFSQPTNTTNAVHIAFTSSGLKNLELPDKALCTFSREFLEGMSFVDPVTKIEERSTLLGDTGNNHPDNWHWGNNEDKKRVDCILMLFALNSEKLRELKKDIFDAIQDKGVHNIHFTESFVDESDEKKEHFGFNDGISQPIIIGLNKSKKNDNNFANEEDEYAYEAVVKSGEFILGYKNSYDYYSRSPYVDGSDKSIELDDSREPIGKKDLGKNGTYMVFRQIEQHVERFWNFHYQNSKEAGATPAEKAIKLAAKMVGRWPNGKPLVTHPSPGCPMKESLNDFSYSTLDKDGINCPLGAHIRRTNPRDQAHAGRGPENSLEVSNKHRMLRRGRIYGEPLADKMNIVEMLNKAQNFVDPTNNSDEQNYQTPIKRGLHFICLVSDIGRQFEFVQSVWANTPTFADLSNEVDPLISSRSTPEQPNCNKFTTPQKTIRNRYMNVPEFTTVVGGAYFFMPGIKALKYILK